MVIDKKCLIMLKNSTYSIEDLKKNIEQLLESGLTFSLETSTTNVLLKLEYDKKTHRVSLIVIDHGKMTYYVEIRDLLLILDIVQMSNDHSFKSDKLDVIMLPTEDLLFGF